MTLPIMPPATDFAYQVEDAATLLARFEQAPNWQERYRQIMLLGKVLPSLTNELRLESAQVKGCESDAWLYHIEQDGKHYFLADSDARIVKGLIGLLLSACHGKQSDEILAFDPSAYFKQLGLEGQLSPSRTNGLHALAKAIIDAVKP
ncbi:SufE family protein [Shewanella sp. DNRA4]|uniref:SufE family protein n=1 Tax=Shewanella sp. DNRA4 TaxID=2723055 RepID=UPI001469B4A9|nr:SufE family protein [Shewanella sp. DNRA4]NMD50965.1 SufE family protein [Shewanella sp. DNRA4]